MLEFEPVWFFVLLANFLFLIFMLNLILFKPLIGIFKERESTVKGSMEAAKEMAQKRDKALDDLKRALSEASQRARSVYEELRNEGLSRQKESVSLASQEAMRLTEEARDALRKEAERARQSLRQEVERFSEEIVRKLVKV